MAIEIYEGFDSVDSNQDIKDLGWCAAEGALVAAGGKFGGVGYELSGNDDNVLAVSIPFVEYLTISFYWRNKGASLVSGYICGCSDHSAPYFDPNSSYFHGGIAFTANGEVYFVRDGMIAGTYSTTGVVSANTWHHIELQMQIAASATCHVYVDGVLAASDTGDFIDGSSYTSVIFYGDEDVNAFDDVVVQTDASTHPPILGEHQVQVLYPDADTAQADFTPLSGSGFSNIDEAASDGDTSYISSATAGHKSAFTLSGLTGSMTHPLAVKTKMAARKDSEGYLSVRSYLDSGGTLGNGAATDLATSYGNRFESVENDPATGSDWSSAAIAALKIGVERIS